MDPYQKEILKGQVGCHLISRHCKIQCSSCSKNRHADVNDYSNKIYVTGMEIGLRIRQRGSDAFIVFGVLAWMLPDVQMNGDVSNAYVQWFSHWKIKADDCDIMK